MLFLQGYPVCEEVPDFTTEDLMELQGFEIEYIDPRRQASKTDHPLHANGKQLEKNSNASPRRLYIATEQ